MKIVKFVCICIFMFFLTGCNNKIDSITVNTVRYDLNIDKSFDEKIVFSFNNKENQIVNDEVGDDYVSIKDHIANNNIYAIYYENNVFYNKRVNKGRNVTNVELRYNFVENEFIYHNLIMSCFENYEINSKDGYFEINLMGKFSCLNDMDKIDINISTNYNVEDTNGEKIDNRYHWVINRDNVDFSYIKFKINRDYKSMSKEVVNKKNNKVWIGIIKIIGLMMLIFIVYRVYTMFKIKMEL